jgi:hypothetical protein
VPSFGKEEQIRRL